MKGGIVKDGNTKVDNDQYAYVRLTKRSNASTVYARVRKGATVATDELPIKSLNQTKSVKYKISVKKGDTMKIQFQATTQTQTISGKWTS